MRFNGSKILRRSEDWIEIQTEEGPATLRGYNPALIEYESVDEAREDKRKEIRRRAEEETEAIAPRYAREKAARDIGRGRPPRARVSRLDEIAEKAEELEDRLDAAGTIEEIEMVAW